MPCLPLSFSLGIILVVGYYLYLTWEGGASMKKPLFILAGIVAIILVLWGIATHLDSKINSRDSQNWLSITGVTISIQNSWKFTEETGIQVQYETLWFQRSHMYTKIKQGGTTYDIAIPSEYMINKMKDEDLLVPPWLFKTWRSWKYRTRVSQPVLWPRQ